MNVKKVKKVIIRLGIILLLLICLVAAFFYRASAPVRKEQKEITQVAKKYANLETVDAFYWYNGNNTYYTVAGKNNKNQHVLVTVPKDDDKIIIQNQANGISESDASKKVNDEFHPKKIEKVEFGYYKNKPIWEVTTTNKDKQVSYYILAFQDGNLIKKIENF